MHSVWSLLVEFVKAVQALGECLMCGAKVPGGGLQGHELGCAIRRADGFIKSLDSHSAEPVSIFK
jgi:hypothetical protein